MANISHTERLHSRFNDIWTGRRVTFEWAAFTCGVDVEDFKQMYADWLHKKETEDERDKT